MEVNPTLMYIMITKYAESLKHVSIDGVVEFRLPMNEFSEGLTKQ